MPELPVPDLDAKPAVVSSAPAPAPETPASPATTDVSAASSPAPDATPAPSAEPDDIKPAPSAEPSEKSELLKAVTKAIQPKETPKEAKAPEKKAQDGEEPEEADSDLPEDPTPEEMEGYTAKTQKRINQLLTERNAAYQRVAEIEPFREYMTENELSGEDLAFSLSALATLRKGDYEGFLQQVQPFVQMALEYTGRAVPPDLDQQVKAGRLSPEAAVAMTRQRYDLGEAQQRLQRVDAEQEVQQEERLRESNRSAVQVWEQSVKANDPDYAKKLEVAKAFVASIRAEHGEPTNPQEALAIAKEAYNRASSVLRNTMPQRQATPMSPSGLQRSPTPGATPVPQTLMEAAMQGLQRARAS